MGRCKKRIICSIIVLVTFGFVTEGRRITRITGGEVARKCEFPYNVRLLAIGHDLSLNICGGALISLTHVATAAHCVENTQREVVHCGITNINDRDVKRIPFKRKFIHPGYVPASQANGLVSQCDLAVGILKERINMGYAIIPIALPSGPVDRKKIHVMSGWGKVNETTDSTILRKMWVHIYEKHECVLEPGELCGDSSDADFCSGDSGSPLAYAGTLVGIAVRSQCEIGHVHAYTNVYHFSTWIKGKLNQS